MKIYLQLTNPIYLLLVRPIRVYMNLFLLHKQIFQGNIFQIKIFTYWDQINQYLSLIKYLNQTSINYNYEKTNIKYL